MSEAGNDAPEDGEVDTPVLWRAVMERNLRKVTRLLSAPPGSTAASSFNINETGGVHGGSALHTAVQRKDRGMIDLLLGAAGIDVNAKDDLEEPPLFETVTGRCTLQDLDIVEKLLQHGALAGATNIDGSNILHVAASESNVAVLEFFVTRRLGLDVSVRNHSLRTPLHFTSRLDIARLLVDAGADVNAQTEDGDTPLHAAAPCETTEVEMIKFLLANGADVNAPNFYGCTALYLTSIPSTFVVLVDAGASVYVRNADGYTVLHGLVLANAAPDLIVLVLDRGVGVNIKTNDGLTALHCACDPECSFELALVLLQAGALCNEPSNDGWTPLHTACQYGMEHLAMTLLHWGADPFARTNDGKTPADVAILGFDGKTHHDLSNAVTIQSDMRARLLAFGMAGQQRLGSESTAAVLLGVQDIFRMVVDPDYLTKKLVIEL